LGKVPARDGQGKDTGAGVARDEHETFTNNKTSTREERHKMKTNRINTLARLCGMTFAAALLVSTVGVLTASEIPTGKGGATKLLELSGTLVTPKSTPSDYKPMSCGKCKDEVVQVRDTDSKGGARALLTGVPLTKSVSRHSCEGCGTDWNVVGHGKAKVSVASHKCTSCGEASLACCSTSKSGITATKGMEKKFEVAPVK
jgi:hypothetical protein